MGPQPIFWDVPVYAAPAISGKAEIVISMKIFSV
jgi:hypothetical protein